MKNKKNKKVLLLVLLLLGVTIGFAALATTLKINGTTGISSNRWNVYWENKSVNVESVSQATPTLSAEQGKTALTIATWSATLNLPGDFYEFTINAVNAGTIDAMISEAGVVTTYEAGSQSPSTLPSYISYTVTYEDGTPVAAYHLLAKKNGNTPTKEAYKVRVEFLDTITPEQLNAIPEGGYSYTFTTQVQYVQADSNAIDSHPTSAYTYYGYDVVNTITRAATQEEESNTHCEDDYNYNSNLSQCYKCPDGYTSNYNDGEPVCISDDEVELSNSKVNEVGNVYYRTDGTDTEICGMFSEGQLCITYPKGAPGSDYDYAGAGGYFDEVIAQADVLGITDHYYGEDYIVIGDNEFNCSLFDASYSRCKNSFIEYIIDTDGNITGYNS